MPRKRGVEYWSWSLTRWQQHGNSKFSQAGSNATSFTAASVAVGGLVSKVRQSDTPEMGAVRYTIKIESQTQDGA